MKPRRMLVTGAAGMVGRYVPEVFPDLELILTDHGHGYPLLDIRDEQAVMAFTRGSKPDVVLHLAAATDVDRCEQEPAWAEESNAVGTRNVALACKEVGVRMIHVSTGAVFWGDKPEPYIEEDDPRPFNVYGRSKLAGEQQVQQLLPDGLIVRAGWMFGGEERDKKFVGKMVRLIRERDSLQVVDDKWGTPTYAKDFLEGIRSLIERDRQGLYHLGNDGCCTRYEIALHLKEILGQSKVQILPVSSDHFPLPAPRGRQEGIANLRLKREGQSPMRPWKEAMTEYLQLEWAMVSG